MSTYLKFYELQKSPFESESNRGLVLGTQALRAAFAEVRAGLEDEAPRICLNGGSGMGKTSLARALPKLLAEQAQVALLLDPTPAWPVIRAALVRQFGLEGGVLSRRALTRARAAGRRLVLVIDQAERVSREVLDHLDVLLGYRSDSDQQLLHCVLLANLSAARDSDDHPLLWWLDSLNTLQLEFAPIPAAGIQSYIHKHLKRAGWSGEEVFSEEAAKAVHRHTGGVPRAVSRLAERALAKAAERGSQQIDADLIEALDDEHLGAATPKNECATPDGAGPTATAPDEAAAGKSGDMAAENGERDEEAAAADSPGSTGLDYFFASRQAASGGEQDEAGPTWPTGGCDSDAEPQPEFWPPEVGAQERGGGHRMLSLSVGIISVALVFAGAALLRGSGTAEEVKPVRHSATASAGSATAGGRGHSARAGETSRSTARPAAERTRTTEPDEASAPKPAADAKRPTKALAGDRDHTPSPPLALAPSAKASPFASAETDAPREPGGPTEPGLGPLPAAPADAAPPGAAIDEHYW